MSGNSKTYSLFASDTAEVTDKIFLTGSLRYNHTKVSNTLSTPNEVTEELEAQPKETFGKRALSKIVELTHAALDFCNSLG